MPSFSFTELIGLFHEGLVALTPTMNRARIAWQGERVFDPWENIERTLYESIVGSCVENAVASQQGLPLAPYGLHLPNYIGYSFLTATSAMGAAFLELQTRSEAFDEAAFLELDDGLAPTGKEIRQLLAHTSFIIVTRQPNAQLVYSERIEYED